MEVFLEDEEVFFLSLSGGGGKYLIVPVSKGDSASLRLRSEILFFFNKGRNTQKHTAQELHSFLSSQVYYACFILRLDSLSFHTLGMKRSFLNKSLLRQLCAQEKINGISSTHH